MRRSLALCLMLFAAPVLADEAAVKSALARSLIAPRTSLLELQDHLEARLPKLPRLQTAAEWQKYAAGLRRDILDRVVLRGEAKKWAAAPGKVEYLKDVPGGKGYRIRKLRYQAVP